MQTFFSRAEYLAACTARALWVYTQPNGEDIASDGTFDYGSGKESDGTDGCEIGYVACLFEDYSEFVSWYEAGAPLGQPT